MSVLTLLAGVLLLLLLLRDVYVTVFVARGPAGPITGRLYVYAWQLWHRLFGHSTPEARRRLSHLGPLLVPLTILIWAFVLWLGFALIFLPYARQFQLDGAAPFPGWFNALYISGYSITTLGIGDVTPTGMALRLVMVLAGATGFILITVAVTYLLSVSGALGRMTSLSFEIYRFVGRDEGYGPVNVLIVAARTQSHDELTNWLGSTASALSQVVQSEDEFPLLHYFHMPNERAMPLALADLLEIVTLCRTLLDPEVYPVVTQGLVSAGTQRIVMRYFHALRPKYERIQVEAGRVEQDRQRRFEASWAALEAGGVRLRTKGEAWQRYWELRQEWDTQSASLCLQFGYPCLEDWPALPGRQPGARKDFVED
ncbi:potassium channel family protein [Deinococcus hopiensis]|uniref:Ion channel n=1 Tax=Deinococcus hopiensis KR-140 TaxID=695939 RepID=A0A1W1UNU7_9DEIO|nr:potassium channel family protein [Deinococcus hopiensis]SMB82795.1 Ion channel [Deinococcus hopiensis KR-140]